MPGIILEFMSHQLSVSPGFQPVLQKKWKMGPETAVVVEEQVENLVKAGFIKEITYPTWLLNVMMVKKSNGKW